MNVVCSEGEHSLPAEGVGQLVQIGGSLDNSLLFELLELLELLRPRQCRLDDVGLPP